jgi:hypothetical protein
MTMMASKDDNKRKDADGAEKEVEEEAPLKKQKTMGNYNGDNDDGDDSSLSTNDYLLSSEEEK